MFGYGCAVHILVIILIRFLGRAVRQSGYFEFWCCNFITNKGAYQRCGRTVIHNGVGSGAAKDQDDNNDEEDDDDDTTRGLKQELVSASRPHGHPCSSWVM